MYERLNPVHCLFEGVFNSPIMRPGSEKAARLVISFYTYEHKKRGASPVARSTE